MSDNKCHEILTTDGNCVSRGRGINDVIHCNISYVLLEYFIEIEDIVSAIRGSSFAKVGLVCFSTSQYIKFREEMIKKFFIIPARKFVRAKIVDN